MLYIFLKKFPSFCSGFISSILLFFNQESLSVSIDDVGFAIGLDERERPCASVCIASMYRHHPKADLDIRFVGKTDVSALWDAKQLTEYGRSRFLTPSLFKNKKYSVYMDGHTILNDDIEKLASLIDDRYTIQVVKQIDYSKTAQKHEFMGRTIPFYPSFNSSSMIIFHNEKCRELLTDHYVNIAPYEDLHQFKWVKNEKEIGELPKKWSHLVARSEPLSETPALLQWTKGSPHVSKQAQTEEYADLWFENLAYMLQISIDQAKQLYTLKEELKAEKSPL